MKNEINNLIYIPILIFLHFKGEFISFSIVSSKVGALKNNLSHMTLIALVAEEKATLGDSPGIPHNFGETPHQEPHGIPPVVPQPCMTWEFEE